VNVFKSTLHFDFEQGAELDVNRAGMWPTITPPTAKPDGLTLRGAL
jgi:hypothetical protein